MPATSTNLFGARLGGLLFPFAVVALLLVLLVPLPAPVLDGLLICNLTLSVLVLLTTLYARTPLEFSVFPSLLLSLTLFRLVLNVAVTRLVLTAGDRVSDPSGPQAIHAAGDVVMTFGNFVTGGSLAVGAIIFAIIVIIQFVVITRGAARISEVAARFVLDAMPGRQMAIDADLNSGALTQAQAAQLRDGIAREADFYGAMDGAGKFVRGDAVAAVLITFVNILGGLYVGLVEHHWPLADCLRLFTRLTIGDGLVSQIPALIVALAAGLLVTRASSAHGAGSLGEDLVGQLLSKPRAMIIATGFVVLMALTSLPKLPLAVTGACCGALAYVLTRNERTAAAVETASQPPPPPREPEKVEQLLDLDALELEVGYGLVRLVDATQGGDLLERIAALRRQIALDLGLIVPAVRIRDNVALAANDYVIKIKGHAIARGVAYPEQLLAVDDTGTAGPIAGAAPAETGMPGVWITTSQRAEAEHLGYALSEAPGMVIDHLTSVIQSHAADLLGRQEVKGLLDNLKLRAGALVEEVVPAQISPGQLQRVLQNLLRERLSIRDLETILETIQDYAPRSKDPDLLSEYCRGALSRSICMQHVDDADRMRCVTLDPALEDLVAAHLDRADHGPVSTLPPRTAQRMVHALSEALAAHARLRPAPVILCSPQVRAAVARMMQPAGPRVAVLAFNEIVPEVTVESLGMVSLDADEERSGTERSVEGVQL